MKDALKQRLLGALILIALGVVFWPLIFVPPKEGPAVSEASMPPRPLIDRAALPVPDGSDFRSSPRISDELDSSEETQIPRTGSFGSSSDADNAMALEASPPDRDGGAPESSVNKVAAATPKEAEAKVVVPREPRKSAPVAPKLDDQGIPVAWILQVASVSSADNAEQLRKRLLAMGHKAYTKRIDRDGRTLVRVAVGPRSEKAQLEAIKTDIDREFGVQSIIARYLP